MKNTDNPNPALGPREENDTDNPYPGLRPFEENDSRYFSGRDTQKQELLKRLAANRFVAVMGSSGSGKSSLVKAGLIPLLKANYVPAEMKSAPWKVLMMTPGSNPLLNLAIIIRQAFPESIGQQSEEDVQESLRLTLQDGIAEVLDEDEDTKDHNILLVIDQFEELFTHEDTDSSEFKAVVHNDRSDFVALLLETIKQTRRNIYIVTTMRSEYLGECSTYIGLSEAFGKAVFIVPMLSIDEMREAIEKPASKVGVRVDRKLVDRIIHDVETELDQLPVLQNSLHLMFENIASADNPDPELTLDDYQDLKTALDTFADEVYKGKLRDGSARPDWTKKDRLHAELLFRNICIRDITGERVRRPATIKQLMRVTGLSKKQLVKVVDVFRADDCNFLTPFTGKEAELSATTEINIVHESLIRKWVRLTKWVDDEAKLADSFRGHCKAALEWNKYGEGSDGLALDDIQFNSLARWFERKRKLGGLNNDWCSRHWDANWEKEYGKPQSFDYLSLLRRYRKSSEKFRSRKRNLLVAGIAAVVILAIAVTIYVNLVNIKLKHSNNVSLASNFLKEAEITLLKIPPEERGSKAHLSGHFIVEAYAHFTEVVDVPDMFKKGQRLCNNIIKHSKYYTHQQSGDDSNPGGLEPICLDGSKKTHKQYLQSLREQVCQNAKSNLFFPAWARAAGGFWQGAAQFPVGCKDLLDGISAEAFESLYFELLARLVSENGLNNHQNRENRNSFARRKAIDIFEREREVVWAGVAVGNPSQEVGKLTAALEFWRTEGFSSLKGKNEYRKIALHIEKNPAIFFPPNVPLDVWISDRFYPPGYLDSLGNLLKNLSAERLASVGFYNEIINRVPEGRGVDDSEAADLILLCQCGYANGHSRQALAICNRAMQGDNESVPGGFYQVRAVAHALNGNYEKAHSDLDQYSQWISSVDAKGDARRLQAMLHQHERILTRLRDNIPDSQTSQIKFTLPPPKTTEVINLCHRKFIEK